MAGVIIKGDFLPGKVTMKRTAFLIASVIVVLATGPLRAQEPQARLAQKYAAPLARIFDLHQRFAPLHPALAKVYPVAIAEDKMIHVFEPEPGKKAYRLALTAPDTMNLPQGIRAAMPLGFWDNRMACVVTGEVFGQPDGYVFIFHEFVHCAQWDCCDLKLKSAMTIFQEAMKTKDYMWELQYPFPYGDAAFVKTYGDLLKAWEGNDAAGADALRTELKRTLSPANWEYMTWQEWKEGLARYLENKMRGLLALPENKGGGVAPFTRVTFYRGGDLYIRFLERATPGAAKDMEKLYRLISAR